ncbi:hypothetical protein M5D96_000729, partial [Drosophila gunungcola]
RLDVLLRAPGSEQIVFRHRKKILIRLEKSTIKSRYHWKYPKVSFKKKCSEIVRIEHLAR